MPSAPSTIPPKPVDGAARSAPPAAQPVERCAVCGGPSPHWCDKSAHGRTWHIHRCRHCGHGFVSNRPSIELLQEIYSREQDPVSPGNHSGNFDLGRPDCESLVEAVCRLSPPAGDSLDVGSGDGYFSYHLSRRGFRPWMIDLDPRAERAAAKIPGARFRLSTFEDFADHYRETGGTPNSGTPAGGTSLSVIVMSQVLEHALDPLDWLRRAAGLLAPDGVLAIAVPNFAGPYRLLGPRDPFVSPPIHLNFFTPRSMARALRASGLRPVAMDSRNEIYNGGPGGGQSFRRRFAGRLWNLMSPPLNRTRYGIILRAFARPART